MLKRLSVLDQGRDDVIDIGRGDDVLVVERVDVLAVGRVRFPCHRTSKTFQRPRSKTNRRPSFQKK